MLRLWNRSVCRECRKFTVLRQCFLGKIQPDLYRRRGSLINLGSTSKDLSIQNVGQVKLQLNYDFAKSDFVVKLVEGRVVIGACILGIMEVHIQCRYHISSTNANSTLR